MPAWHISIVWSFWKARLREEQRSLEAWNLWKIACLQLGDSCDSQFGLKRKNQGQSEWNRGVGLNLALHFLCSPCGENVSQTSCLKAGHFAHLSAAMGVEDVRKMERYLTKNYRMRIFEKPTGGWNSSAFPARKPPGMFSKPPVNDGINYQPQLVPDFFHQQYGLYTLGFEESLDEVNGVEKKRQWSNKPMRWASDFGMWRQARRDRFSDLPNFALFKTCRKKSASERQKSQCWSKPWKNKELKIPKSWKQSSPKRSV